MESLKQYVTKEVEIGLYPDGVAYADAISGAGMRIEEDAEKLLRSSVFFVHPHTMPEKTQIVLLPFGAFGFSEDETREGITLEQLIERVGSLGIFVCQPEIGPALRLAFTNQSDQNGTNPAADVVIVMDGLEDATGNKQIFRVYVDEHEGTGPSLGVEEWTPNKKYSDKHRRYAFTVLRGSSLES